MKPIVAVVVLALTACASQPSATRELHRGAPTVRVPVTTYTPQGAHVPPTGSLPEYWATPRQPPAFKTEPPFATLEPVADPTVLGVKLPVSSDSMEFMPVNQCLNRIHKALREDAARRRVVNTTTEQKRNCIVHDWLAGCLLELKAQLEAAETLGAKFHPPAVEALGRMQNAAQRRSNHACAGITGKGGTLTAAEHDAWVQIQRTVAFGMGSL